MRGTALNRRFHARKGAGVRRVTSGNAASRRSFRFYNEAIARKAPRTENMRSLIDFFKDWDEYETGGVYSQRASNRYPDLIDVEALRDLRGRLGWAAKAFHLLGPRTQSAASASRAAPLAR
jgi:hypothetical protein